MSRHYYMYEGGYITAIGIGYGGTEITETEYMELQALLREKPVAEVGFDYRLKTDRTWEKVERIMQDVNDVEILISETEQKAMAYDILMGVTE